MSNTPADRFTKSVVIPQLDAVALKYQGMESIDKRKPCITCGGTDFKCDKKVVRILTFRGGVAPGGFQLPTGQDWFVLETTCGHCGSSLGTFKPLWFDSHLAEWRAEAEKLPD